MLKHPFWLAVMALLVMGGVSVYVQSQRSGRLPEFPSDPTPNLVIGNAAQRRSAAETSPPPAANATTPATPPRACPQATALPPATPDIYFPRPALTAGPAVPSVFSADPPDPAASLSRLIAELGTSSACLKPHRAGDDQGIGFFNKRPDQDDPLTFGFNNASGIGPQYRLIKNEDTTLLGRVAGRYCQVCPGLSEEERISELFLGCQVEHRLGRRNKVFSAVEYARDPADLTSHRVRTQAAWEVLLDPEETLSLRTAVLESSNYAPNREQAKDLNYSLNLIWKF